jgi:hypothetical protein
MSTARKWPPEADTVIVNPETGLPVITESLDIDHIAACRGWCNQGRQPCKTPHVCKTGRKLHRIVEVLSLPDDHTLADKTIDEIDADNRDVLIACAVLAVAIICLAVFVAGLRVPV